MSCDMVCITEHRGADLDHLGVRAIAAPVSKTDWLCVWISITPSAPKVAMAAEVPVISTNAGGLPEININDYSGYLSNVGDVEEMSTNALKLLNDDEKFAEFRKNALAQAMKFDINTIVPQYEELYKKFL